MPCQVCQVLQAEKSLKTEQFKYWSRPALRGKPVRSIAESDCKQRPASKQQRFQTAAITQCQELEEVGGGAVRIDCPSYGSPSFLKLFIKLFHLILSIRWGTQCHSQFIQGDWDQRGWCWDPTASKETTLQKNLKVISRNHNFIWLFA